MVYRLLGGCAAFILLKLLLHFVVTPALQEPKCSKRFDTILTFCMVLTAFINLFLPDLWGARFFELPDLLWDVHDPLFSVVRLCSAAMIVTLPIALHYHRKTFSRFVVFFGLPTFLANCLLADKYMYCYQNALNCPLTELSRTFTTNPGLRIPFFIVFELLKLCMILRVVQKHREDLHFSGCADVGKFLLFSLPLLFTNMPTTFPSQFIGRFCSNVVIKSCNAINLIWMAVIVLMIVGYTLLFKGRSAEDKHILLMVLSSSLLFQYSTFFNGTELMMIQRLPFQLCNFACFFLPIAVQVNKRPLLCFASIANVLGAIAAVIMCDTPGGYGILYSLNVHYIVEHTGIIVIGFLLLTLGVITPLQKKDLYSILKIFNAYFFAVLVMGTVFNAIHAANGFQKVVLSADPYVTMDYSCNYLYMFMEAVVVKTAPALAVLYRTYLPIGRYARLQLSELVMYVCFTIICVGPFFIFRAIFKGKNGAPEDSKKGVPDDERPGDVR